MGGKEQIERELAEIQRKEARANAWSREEGGILSLPFRQAYFFIWRGFHGVKKALTNQGFLKLHVKGNNITWKLEHRAAWALDEGQVLDKLVKVKFV